MKEKLQQKIIFLFLSIAFVSCKQKTNVDLIFYNSKVYTLDTSENIFQAIAVTDGKVISLGTNQEILDKYKARKTIDLENRQTIFPGFYDTHSHFTGLGMYHYLLDLTGVKSEAEMLQRCKAFSEKLPKNSWIIGRGWDQHLWENKQFPDNRLLNEMTQEHPVLLVRVDGHAALANSKALELAGIDENSKIEGGDIHLKNGKMTGILLDNAVDLVKSKIPRYTREEKIKFLMAADSICMHYGLTTVTDAGLEPEEVLLIDSLQKAGIIQTHIYAMLSISDKNISWLKNKGKIQTGKLNVRSFKLYADGSLGSRGACLINPYSDSLNHYGMLLTPYEKIKAYCRQVSETDFQLNTHAIGDSANRIMLKLYTQFLEGKTDKRWRLEHAQTIYPSDTIYYQKNRNVLASMQPTHETSDMPWAKKRIGDGRLAYAYALKLLMNQTGMIALGTDFPVENVNPLETFYAAVYRKKPNEKEANALLLKNSLAPLETLKGMTTWAAYYSFEEAQKGSLEKGKTANITILDTDILEADENRIKKAKVTYTVIDGKIVYQNKFKP